MTDETTGERRSRPHARMSGASKAATIMLLLGEKKSAPIWEHLEEDEVRLLSIAMSELGTVPGDVAESLITEFATSFSDRDKVVGSYDRTEAFLKSVLNQDQAEAIMDEIRGQSSRNVWRKMSSVDPASLSSYLMGEHPQTVALILSRLPPKTTANALSNFKEQQAADVLNRMLTLNSVQKEALESVEQVLQAEFLSGLTRTVQRDLHVEVADVFNALDRQTEKRLMEALERTNDPAATRIKKLMFTFDDLTKLQPAAIQTLLGGIDRQILTQALKGSPDETREIFTKNMSTRAAKMLTDDIAALGPMRMKDVEQAQASLIQHAKDLEAKGEIVLGRSSEDEFV